MPTRDILLNARKLGVGEATSIRVTKNLCTKPHRDANSQGPSWIFGLGDWTEGGETCVQDDSGTEQYELQEHIPSIGPKGVVSHGLRRDIHTLRKSDGTKIHCTVPFKGARYAITLYAINRSYHETPALTRALFRLGFNLPLHEFEASLRPEDEELARAAIEGRPVADRGRLPGLPSRADQWQMKLDVTGRLQVVGGGAAWCRARTACHGLFRSPIEPDAQEQWTHIPMWVR